MRSRVVLVGLTGSAADTRVHCGGLSAVLCYTDGIGAPLPSTFIDTIPIESLHLVPPRWMLSTAANFPCDGDLDLQVGSSSSVSGGSESASGRPRG